MSITQSYHDLLKEIEYLEITIDDLRREKRKLRRILDNPFLNNNLIANYGVERVQTSPQNFVELHVEERYEEISTKIRVLQDLLIQKLETKRKLEEKLSEFEGLDYKIAYMYEVQGKPLYQIADELGYSYIWIRKKYANAKHKHKIV